MLKTEVEFSLSNGGKQVVDFVRQFNFSGNDTSANGIMEGYCFFSEEFLLIFYMCTTLQSR